MQASEIQYPNHVPYRLHPFRIALSWLLLFISGAIAGQGLTFEILRQGTDYSDSSFYDIQPKNENEYWIAGKYGIFKTINSDYEVKNVACNTGGLDVYKLDSAHGIAMGCGDLGSVYIYDSANDSWSQRRVEGYEKSCFYHIEICNPNSIFICGGVSAIAHSKKRIPHGFILHSSDGGLTWKEVYNNPFQMVWTVEYDERTNLLYALMYSPNRTLIYKSSDGVTWKKDKNLRRGIYQDLQISESDIIAMGGEPWGNGRLKANEDLSLFNDTGIIWSRTEHDGSEYLTASKGILISRNESHTEIFKIPLNLEFNLYELTFITSDAGFIVGSGGTIIKVIRHTAPSANVQE